MLHLSFHWLVCALCFWLLSGCSAFKTRELQDKLDAAQLQALSCLLSHENDWAQACTEQFKQAKAAKADLEDAITTKNFLLTVLAARLSQSHAMPQTGSGSSSTLPGMPSYDATGRPYQWIPQSGSGAVLGPVTPNVYGPGTGMDATGRPVQAVPWP